MNKCFNNERDIIVDWLILSRCATIEKTAGCKACDTVSCDEADLLHCLHKREQVSLRMTKTIYNVSLQTALEKLMEEVGWNVNIFVSFFEEFLCILKFLFLQT